jgi:ribose transport system substrate-binding protein
MVNISKAKRAAALGAAAFIGLSIHGIARAEEAFHQSPGYQGVPRTWLWNPVGNESVDTSKYKKTGPFVIGFSNSSISNAWRVAFQHGILWSAGEHKDQIKRFIVTDANDDPLKQISDVQDLINQGVDALIVAPATEEALDPIVGRAMKQGIPVILVDRRVKSDGNFVTFVTTSTTAMGRIYAQWLVETLKGKGNIVYLGGIPGASPGEFRHAGAMEVLARYPDIHVLDMQYTNWNPATGKSVMAALIQKYGHKIDGVLSDSALQGSGAVEAFIDAGYKKGEIPPITGGDIARMYQLAVKYDIPMVGIDYPTSVGIDTVEATLDVLSGKTVPKTFEVNTQVVVSKGRDTASVKGDRTPEETVSMDAPGDLSTSNGMPAGYDPRTFHPDYPH